MRVGGLEDGNETRSGCMMSHRDVRYCCSSNALHSHIQQLITNIALTVETLRLRSCESHTVAKWKGIEKVSGMKGERLSITAFLSQARLDAGSSD